MCLVEKCGITSVLVTLLPSRVPQNHLGLALDSFFHWTQHAPPPLTVVRYPAAVGQLL